MTHRFADRVLQASTTTGTGAYVLGAALPGFRALASVPGLVAGDTLDCYVEDGTNWETGVYTWTGAALERSLVTDSSNAGAPVAWGTGTKRIGAAWTAARARHVRHGALPLVDLGSVSGPVTLDLDAGRAFRFVATGDVTLSIAGAVDLDHTTGLTLYVDSGTHAVQWPAEFRWPLNIAPTLSVQGKTLIEAIAFGDPDTFAARIKATDLEYVGATPYRYFRLDVQAITSGSYVAIGELELREAAGGPDVTAPSTSVSASAESLGAGYGAVKLLDGHFGDGSCYATGWSGEPVEVLFDLLTPRPILEIAMWPQYPDGALGNMPRNFDVLGSHDGSTWTLIKSFTGETWSSNLPRSFVLL